jgi:hypothetical protein
VSLLLANLNASALIGTAHQWNITDTGGGILRGFTPQDIDVLSIVHFGGGTFSPDLAQFFDGQEAVKIGGTSCTNTTAQLGFYDSANTAPELQLGLFCLNGNQSKPYIGFNTWWDSNAATWRNSKPNVSGIVMFDAYSDGQLYIVTTGNDTTSNSSVAISGDIARFRQDLVTSFVPFGVGRGDDTLVGADSGIHVAYFGFTFVDVPRTTDFLLFVNEFPRYQRAVLDTGQVSHFYEGYIDSTGTERASNALFDPIRVSVGNSHFQVARAPTTGVGNAVVYTTRFIIQDDYAQFVLPLFTQGTHADDQANSFAEFALDIGSFPVAIPTAQFAAVNTTSILLGFGIYTDASTFHYGNTNNGSYALYKGPLDELNVVRADTAAPGTIVSPTTLASFKSDAVDFYQGVRFPTGTAACCSGGTTAILNAYATFSGSLNVTGPFNATTTFTGTRIGNIATVHVARMQAVGNCVGGNALQAVPLPAGLLPLTALSYFNAWVNLNMTISVPARAALQDFGVSGWGLSIAPYVNGTVVNDFGSEVCSVLEFDLTYLTAP